MALLKWYHFIPGVGQFALAVEVIDKGFDNKTASANAVFNEDVRPKNLEELKQKLNLEIESYDKRIDLNKKEMAISNIFAFVYARGIDVVAPGGGQVFLKYYTELNQSNLSLKEKEIIEWLNAVQVRVGILSLLDNPNIKFSFDVYDTKSYPKNAEALKKSVFDISEKIEVPENKPKTGVNVTFYLAIAAVFLIGGLLVYLLIKQMK